MKDLKQKQNLYPMLIWFNPPWFPMFILISTFLNYINHVNSSMLKMRYQGESNMLTNFLSFFSLKGE